MVAASSVRARFVLRRMQATKRERPDRIRAHTQSGRSTPAPRALRCGFFPFTLVSAQFEADTEGDCRTVRNSHAFVLLQLARGVHPLRIDLFHDLSAARTCRRQLAAGTVVSEIRRQQASHLKPLRSRSEESAFMVVQHIDAGH